MKTFCLSKKELDRRIGFAYPLFLVSLFVGSVLGVHNIFKYSLGSSLLSFGLFAFILYLSHRYTAGANRYFAGTKIIISDELLIRETKKSREVYFLKEIKKITIKRTSKDYLREIKVKLSSGHFLGINGLHGFEEFHDLLLEYCSAKDVVVKRIREPIDFDHPLFYLWFGLFLGFGSFKLMGLFTKINYFYLILTFYNVFIASYVIVKNPIAKRLGPGGRKYDYIMGVFIIVMTLLFFLSFLRYNI